MLHNLQSLLQLYNLHELESTPQTIAIEIWRRVYSLVIFIHLFFCIIYYPNFIEIQEGHQMSLWEIFKNKKA